MFVCASLSWGLYLASLIPLWILAFYNYPSADDINMGLGAHEAYAATGSVLAAWGQGLYMAWYDWLHWMGYFTSTALMSVPPSVFGEAWYPTGVLILTVSLTAAVTFFLDAVLTRAAGLEPRASAAVAALCLFFMVQCLPAGEARVETFFWYCSGANYTLTFCLGLCYLALFVRAGLPGTRRAPLTVLGCVLGFLVGGGNYMTALSCAIASVLGLAWTALSGRLGGEGHGDGVLRSKAQPIQSRDPGSQLQTQNHSGIKDSRGSGAQVAREGAADAARGTVECAKRWAPNMTVQPTAEQPPDAQPARIDASGCLPCLAAMTLCLLAGFALSCFAPGNSVRESALEGYGPLKAIAISLYYTFDYCVNEWTRAEHLVLLLFLAPLFWREAERSRLSFRYPLVVTVVAYGLASANVTPPLYALGQIGAGRLQSLFYLQYLLLLVLTEGYVVGWLRRRVLAREAGANGASAGKDPQGLYQFFLLAAFLWISALSVGVDPEYYTSAEAIRELADGSAAAYRRENEERLDLYRDNTITDVTVYGYEHHPRLLFYTDLTEDWIRDGIARYYHKNSVRLEWR